MAGIAEQESYYGNIEPILLSNWKEQIRSGNRLLEVVDSCKLIEVDTPKLNSMLREMTEFDIAQLKNLRMNLKDKLNRAKVSDPKLHQEIENLKQQKESLLSEKIFLQNQIQSLYKLCLDLLP